MPEQSSGKGVRIDLTPAQVELVKQATGREVATVELKLDELEARIAPSLTNNHNETLLLDDDWRGIR